MYVCIYKVLPNKNRTVNPTKIKNDLLVSYLIYIYIHPGVNRICYVHIYSHSCRGILKSCGKLTISDCDDSNGNILDARNNNDTVMKHFENNTVVPLYIIYMYNGTTRQW
jgi:hypothetical protein